MRKISKMPSRMDLEGHGFQPCRKSSKMTLGFSPWGRSEAAPNRFKRTNSESLGQTRHSSLGREPL